jgi:hypothetical protein
MRSLDDRVRELEQKTRGIPSRFAGGASRVFHLLVMGDGNTVASYGAVNYYGLKYNTLAAPTVVPTTTPSTTPGTLPDNLSWATLYNEAGVASTVWAGTYLTPDGTSGPFVDLTSVIPVNTSFVAFRTVMMQVAATGVYVPVYLPGRLA